MDIMDLDTATEMRKVQRRAVDRSFINVAVGPLGVPLAVLFCCLSED